MSSEGEVDDEHHSNSENSEELGDHHDSDQEEHALSPEPEETKDQSIIETAHGEVDRASKEKDGYGRVDQSLHEDDDDDPLDKLADDGMTHHNVHLGHSKSGGKINFSNMGEEAKQQMMERMSNMNNDDMIDVLQCCLDGQFKPFLASVQLGYIDKDYIIDQNIGRRIIHLMAHYGNIKALRVIFEICEADLAAKDYQGLNVVHYAAGSGEIEALKYLCDHLGRDVFDAKDNAGMTPLMHAVSKNSLICFIYLYFHKNCEIKNIDKKGCNVIHWACYSGSVPILRICDEVGILQQYKDKQDDLQQTPIIKSFFNKNIEAMKILMDANCNLYIRDYRSNTPQEFILRYLPDPKLYEVFLRHKYRQFIRSAANCSEIRKGFVKDIYFVQELWSIYYSRYSNVLPTVLFATLIGMICLTHVFSVFAGGKTEVGIFTWILRLLLYISIVCSFTAFTKVSKAEAIMLPEKDVHDEDSIIQRIVTSIEDGNFSQIPKLRKLCENSDQRVVKYQKVCNFLDKPIGAGNDRIYFIWLIISCVMIGVFDLNMIGKYWSSKDTIFYYRIWACVYEIYDESLFFFLIYIIIQIVGITFFQNYLWMYHAVGRKQTINEVKNSHNYKYIYKRVLDEETKQYFYVHRYYSFCDAFKNVWGFIFNHEDQIIDPEMEQSRFSSVSLHSLDTSGDQHETSFG